MRIIKHGDQFEIGQVTCKRCHCELAYTKKDIEQVEAAIPYTHEEITKNIITCPECHTIIEV